MEGEDAQEPNENEHNQHMKTLPNKSLPKFIAELTNGPVTPIPEGEDWQGLIERISIEGAIQEVSVETFDYFLNVLPPAYLGLGGFAFAEGAEPFRLFWKRNDKHFCRRLSWQETNEFCRLARGGRHAS